MSTIFMTTCEKVWKVVCPVDDQEIIRSFQHLKNKMSTDCVDIDMNMIKTIISQIVKPFSHICNVSFQTGIFPSKMKIANIVPLFKSGERACLQITDQPHCYLNSQKY